MNTYARVSQHVCICASAHSSHVTANWPKAALPADMALATRVYKATRVNKHVCIADTNMSARRQRTLLHDDVEC